MNHYFQAQALFRMKAMLFTLSSCGLLLLIGCQKQPSPQNTSFNQVSAQTQTDDNLVGMTKEQVLKISGAPSVSLTTDSKKEYLKFKDGSGVNLVGGKVVNSFQDPNQQQSDLEYWKDLWQNDPTQVQTVAGNKFQLENASKKTFVIYDLGTGKVARIVHHN